MVPDEENNEPNAWDEVVENAENLTEADAVDEFLAAQKAAEEVTAPVTEGEVLPPLPKEAEPVEQVGPYVDVPEEISVEDKPVSLSSDPIQIVEERPAVQEMQMIRAGNVDIISTPDRIAFLQNNLGVDLHVEQVAKPVVEKAPVAERISTQISAEQKAGRDALARHASRVVHPKPVPTANEISARGTSVPVFRPGTHPMANLLNKPAVAGKGGGY